MDNQLESRITKVVESILDNEALTNHMNDSAAKIFIHWAVEKSEEIARSTEGMDDVSAEEIMYPRLKAIRSIARYIGNWSENPQEILENLIRQLQVIFEEEFTPPNESEKEEFLNIYQNEDLSVVVLGLKEFLLDTSPKVKSKWYDFLFKSKT